MTETTESTMTETTESTKTSIRPNTEGYESSRTASGSKSKHSGDSVAKFLAGRELKEVKSFAIEFTGAKDLATRYDHLNAGQQRMNLGNRIRGFVAKATKLMEKDLAQKEPQGVKGGDELFADLAATYPDVPEYVAPAKKEKVEDEKADAAE